MRGLEGDRVLWHDFLPRPVLCATLSEHFAAVACDDGSVYLYSPSGRRLAPALLLDDNVVRLVPAGPHLMALTAAARCVVWCAAGLVPAVVGGGDVGLRRVYRVAMGRATPGMSRR